LIDLVINLGINLLATAIAAFIGWRFRSRRQTLRTQHPIDQGRARGRDVLMIGCCLLGLVLGVDLLRPYFSAYSLRSQTADLVRKPKWIAYEPSNWNPYQSRNLDLDPVAEELFWIQQAGFDGVITFTSRGHFAEIPRLAKERGLAVIMGVWDPQNYDEIDAAISQREFVNAYCVGHDGWPHRYSYEVLVKAIDHIRFRTGRPVSTTQRINYYLNDKRFLSLGDWLFPDTLLPLMEKDSYVHTVNVERDVATTIQLANKLDQINQGGKPILLKMVGYPAQIDDYDSDVSDDAQAKFFIALGNAQKDVGTSLSTNIFISMYSAFDMSWKHGPPFYDWESQTGLFERDGRPRPAVWEIIKRRLQ
jgi:exo-beta-1,3-glucanase (GH17 family)